MNRILSIALFPVLALSAVCPTKDYPRVVGDSEEDTTFNCVTYDSNENIFVGGLTKASYFHGDTSGVEKAVILKYSEPGKLLENSYILESASYGFTQISSCTHNELSISDDLVFVTSDPVAVIFYTSGTFTAYKLQSGAANVTGFSPISDIEYLNDDANIALEGNGLHIAVSVTDAGVLTYAYDLQAVGNNVDTEILAIGQRITHVYHSIISKTAGGIYRTGIATI
jgi:hypothetical protein